MKVDNITSTNSNKQKRPLINAKSTGYIAVTGMGLAMLSQTKNKFLRKNHKFFAWTSLVAIVAHMYIVLAKHNHKKQIVPPEQNK